MIAKPMALPSEVRHFNDFSTLVNVWAFNHRVEAQRLLTVPPKRSVAGGRV